MKNNKEIMCDDCKRNVPIEEIRYSMAGEKSLRLCSNCRDRTTPRKDRLNKEIKEPLKKEAKKASKINDFEAYFCTRCNYKFRYDLNKDSRLRCPYCSSPAYVTSFKSISSTRILKEVKNMD